MSKNLNTILKKHLLNIIEGNGAHTDFEKAFENLPVKYQGKIVDKVPYSMWQLLEHIRLSQEDILEYMTNPDYVAKSWPESYWPKSASPSDKKAWKNSIDKFQKDLGEIKSILKNPKTDMFVALPFVKKGPLYLREILLVIDHNSYHLGQAILLRRILGAW